MLLLALAFFAPLIVAAYRKARRRKAKGGIHLSLWHRCMSVLLAYMMLITPFGFERLAQADIQYSQLDTRHWSEGDRTIDYTYDDNGSVVTKTTKQTSTSTVLETITYDYNLQNRLEKVTTDDQSGTVEIAEYKYNPDGIRVQKHTWSEVGGTPQGDDVYTDYLIDAYNHTGYAQVFVEDDGTNKTSYIIGDDVLAQATNSNNPEYLLYDGHGSTRQLVASDGTTINDSYS